MNINKILDIAFAGLTSNTTNLMKRDRLRAAILAGENQVRIEELESIYIASDHSLWHKKGYKLGDDPRRQYDNIPISERITELEGQSLLEKGKE